ncbi:hypothetical protein D3C86_1876170 [compost metagenome]
MLKHIGGGDFTAQVQQVICPQAVLIGSGFNGIRHFPHLALLEPAIFVGAEPQAVENSGNA